MLFQFSSYDQFYWLSLLFTLKVFLFTILGIQFIMANYGYAFHSHNLQNYTVFPGFLWLLFQILKYYSYSLHLYGKLPLCIHACMEYNQLAYIVTIVNLHQNIWTDPLWHNVILSVHIMITVAMLTMCMTCQCTQTIKYS